MSDDRTNYVDLVLGYNPSKPAALAAGALYAVVSFALFFRLYRRRNWWGLVIALGTIDFAVGFFIRYQLASSPFSLPLLIGTQLLIIVSPAAFLAFNYIVYGRLMRIFAGDRPGYSLIRPKIVARVFVISDVITFFMQCAGGGLQSQEGTINIGRVILLVGIIAQLISYILFVVLLIHSHMRISKDGSYNKHNFPWQLFYLLFFSSVFILIRGVYRTIELAQGESGYLVKHEIFLYIFDTLPLLFATAIYVPFWPGKYFDIYSSRNESTLPMSSTSVYSTGEAKPE